MTSRSPVKCSTRKIANIEKQTALYNKEGVASIAYRCLDGQGIQAYVPTGNNATKDYLPVVPINYQWENLTVDLDPAWPSQHFILYFSPDATGLLEPYTIAIDGVQLPGVYLGTGNKIRWAFWEDGVFPNSEWITRLLEDGWAGEGPPDYSNRYETKGLLKVNA